MKKFLFNALFALGVYILILLIGFFLTYLAGSAGELTALNITLSVLLTAGLFISAWFCGRKKKIWFLAGTIGGYLLSVFMIILFFLLSRLNDFSIILFWIFAVFFMYLYAFPNLFSPISEIISRIPVVGDSLYMTLPIVILLLIAGIYLTGRIFTLKTNKQGH